MKHEVKISDFKGSINLVIKKPLIWDEVFIIKLSVIGRLNREKLVLYFERI